jgi:hypothetical protein
MWPLENSLGDAQLYGSWEISKSALRTVTDAPLAKLMDEFESFLHVKKRKYDWQPSIGM